MTFEPLRLRAENNYDTLVDSLDHALFCPEEEDQTVQADKEDADINEIVRRFGLTGELPPPRPGGEYGDFSNVVDFQTAMEAITSAQEAFMEIPADLRERFHNDPHRFIEFLNASEENYQEAVELGLVEPRETPPPPTPTPES